MTSLFYRSLQPASLFYLENLQKKSNYKAEYSVYERRIITFLINAKKGKHKTNSPAASRARLLGQLKYYSLSAKAMISQCERLISAASTTRTDLPLFSIYKLDGNLASISQQIDIKLLAVIEDTLNNTSKYRKKQSSWIPLFPPALSQLLMLPLLQKQSTSIAESMLSSIILQSLLPILRRNSTPYPQGMHVLLPLIFVW